ncbi:MAG: hypothetical protein R2731_14755 [Nocardioides sp.]
MADRVLEIRRARPREYPEVGGLTVAAYAPFLAGPSDPYRARLEDAGARDRDAELWVAVDHDGVVGTVTVVTDGSPWQEIARPGEGEFRMLAVHPRAQGAASARPWWAACWSTSSAPGTTAWCSPASPT